MKIGGCATSCQERKAPDLRLLIPPQAVGHPCDIEIYVSEDFDDDQFENEDKDS